MSDCIFCDIIAGRAPASIVWQSEQVLAAVDLRQFNPGHVLIMPCRHLQDIRDLDDATGAALMSATIKLSKAVSAAFPCGELSVWHSAGAAANQEVPHLHIHIHPRHAGDGVLQVYPQTPLTPERSVLEDYASKICSKL